MLVLVVLLVLVLVLVLVAPSTIRRCRDRAAIYDSPIILLVVLLMALGSRSAHHAATDRTSMPPPTGLALRATELVLLLLVLLGPRATNPRRSVPDRLGRIHAPRIEEDGERAAIDEDHDPAVSRLADDALRSSSTSSRSEGAEDDPDAIADSRSADHAPPAAQGVAGGLLLEPQGMVQLGAGRHSRCRAPRREDRAQVAEDVSGELVEGLWGR